LFLSFWHSRILALILLIDKTTTVQHLLPTVSLSNAFAIGIDDCLVLSGDDACFVVVRFSLIC